LLGGLAHQLVDYHLREPQPETPLFDMPLSLHESAHTLDQNQISYNMNPSQHINLIAKRLTPALKKKYAAGVRAHGGGLWKKNVGPEIEGELLDLIVYQFTFSEQVKRLVAAAEALVTNYCPGEISKDLRAALAPFLDKSTKGND
jgi:hypothetical protein